MASLVTTKGKIINKVDNTRSDKVVITEDKLYRKLTPHINKIHRKREWISAVGLVFTTLAPLLSCDFKTFIFPPEVWKALFLIAFVVSCGYFIYSVIIAVVYRKEGVEYIIKDIMTED